MNAHLRRTLIVPDAVIVALALHLFPMVVSYGVRGAGDVALQWLGVKSDRLLSGSE